MGTSPGEKADITANVQLAYYDALLAKALPSLYHVTDNWENYEKMRSRIDERLDAWRMQD